MRTRELFLHFILAIGGVVMLTPFIWMLSLSVKPENEIYNAQIRLFPQQWDWANYTEAFFDAHVGLFIVNGAIVTLGILLFQYLTTIPAAYVLARKDFRLKGVLFAIVLGVLLIPPQVTAIPVYLLMGRLGLINTTWALILPFTTSAFGIFLFRQSFKAFPQDLIDAARVDGANELYILWNLIVPLSLPTLAAFGIFSIVVHWNDLFWPLLVIYDWEKATPPLGITFFEGGDSGDNVGAMMAAATLIVAPLTIAFLVARRRFIEGITMTGIK
ncbi:carbohydrate ABC transporter permease [Adonisia turfae]